MRQDVYERMKYIKKQRVKPNFAAVARQYGCDYRTVKRAYERACTAPDLGQCKRGKRASLLDDFAEIIAEKAENGCTAMAIFRFLKDTTDFAGQYGIVKNFCRRYRQERAQKATIRFETSPGLQAQVDWKESQTLRTRSGESVSYNVFLIVLGYSRYKYIELTEDRSQLTLFRCLQHAFEYFGGVPREILFDNMKTVVDHSRSLYEEPVINSKFSEFSKNAGFKVRLCRAFRPQTKGKVENLAKVMDTLKAYDGEFDSFDELYDTVRRLNSSLNSDKSQATGKSPSILLEKEKEYLNPLPDSSLLEDFFELPITRKVSKESLVQYKQSKYSVNTGYIGKTVRLKISSGTLYIYYITELINVHKISKKKFNYTENDVAEILKSDALKDRSDDEIRAMAKYLLSKYDEIGEEEP